MEPRELFDWYVRQRRLAVPSGYRRDEIRGVTRLTPLRPGLEGVVMFSELAPSAVDAAIGEHIAHFEGQGLPFEWKVYDFDQPTDLRRRLAARGFVAGESEAFMLYDTRQAPKAETLEEIRVAPLASREEIRRLVQLQSSVWNEALGWLEETLLDSPETRVYGAFAGDELVGTGWLEFPPGAGFAELHGGAVLPEWRNRGVYSKLFAVRVEAARHRGRQFLSVDAAPMSRPILRRKGFMFVCETTPYHREPRARTPSHPPP